MQKSELEYIAKQASSLYISHGTDLSTSIFQLSSQSGLNHEQTKRVVEMTNSIVNADLVKEAKRMGHEPNLHFKTAKIEDVVRLRNAHAPDDQEALSKMASMFIVPDLVGRDNGYDMSKVADVVDTRVVLSDMDVAELAGAYLHDEIADGQSFTVESFDDACQFLEEVVKEASVAQELNVADMQDAARDLRFTVVDLIRDGTTPATLKKIAGDKHHGNVDMLVTLARQDLGLADKKKTATAIGFSDIEDAGDGESQMADGAIVMPDHPFVMGLSRVDALLAESEKLAKAKGKAADALKRARKDYQAACASEKMAFVPSAITRKLPGVGGNMVGNAFNAMGAYSQAKGLTRQLKQRQNSAPVVGAMKMADSSKEANVGRALGAAATMTLAGLLGKGLDVGFSQIGKAFKSRNEQKLFAELVQMDPSFGTNPRAREAFDILSKYAPALLKSPRVAHDFIAKQMQYPQSSIEFIQSLTQTQKLHNEGMRSSPGLGSSLSGVFTGAFASGLKDGDR